MPNFRYTGSLLLCLFLLVPVSVQARADKNFRAEGPTGPTIVSPKNPKDSRGETVYEFQGADQKSEPIVPGKLVPPSPKKTFKAKFPKSLKQRRAEEQVSVLGVVADNGDFIDAKVLDTVEPDVSNSALDAVSQWKFHPATLDGRPVALLVKVVVSFRIY
jgi:protein TonB